METARQSIKELKEIIFELVSNDKIDSIEYHSMLTRIDYVETKFLNGNTEKRVANCRHPSWAQSFNGAKNKRHCSICGRYFH